MSTALPRRALAKPVKVKQACDQCHSRKVRCDGANPCRNCVGDEAQCTYLAVHKKTGPKGPRRVAKAKKAQQTERRNQYQEDARQPVPSPASTTSDGSRTVPETATGAEAASKRGMSQEDAEFRPSSRVPIDVISMCLDAFFTYKYPVTPILDPKEIQDALPELANSPEVYGLLTACCSVMVLSPDILKPPQPSASELEPFFSQDIKSSQSNLEVPTSEFLISETLRARRYCNWVESPSLTTIQTSFFLFSAYFCLGKDNPAWFYLREAVTITQLLRFHEEETYENLGISSSLAVYARRMFWVLFITERAYALQRHRLLTLHQTISLPPIESGPEGPILSGFLELIFLFNNFDDEFLNLWNLQSSVIDTSTTSLSRLQNRLQDGLYNISSYTKSQQADLIVSRQWLKTMIWQLCVSKALLSSHSDEESMSIAYPVTISRDVIHLSAVLPPAAFEANGIGIVEKLFDIGCSLADVLTLQPRLANPVAFEFGARDYLMEIMRMVSTVVGGSSKHLEILAVKANECLTTGVDWIDIGMENNQGDFQRVFELDDDEQETSVQGTQSESSYDDIGSIDFIN